MALAPSPAGAQGSVAGDRAALMALYESTDGDNWRRKDNWKSDMPLGTWFGVTTNSDGRVTELDLVISTQGSNRLTGRIPPALGNLSKLTVLKLTGNHHINSQIPSELGDLANLVVLKLNFIVFLTGSIPPAFGNLSKLTTLDLGGNRLTGSIPRTLGNLSRLTELHLRQNRLTGEIPPELGDLGDTLTTLTLSGPNQQLTGCVPYPLRNAVSGDTALALPICPPRATLELTPSNISENGGRTDVTAALEGEWTTDVSLTISAEPIFPAVIGDFTLSANTALTIARGETSSTGTVTITAADNDTLHPNKTVTVSAVATGSSMVTAPEPVTLTIADDDGVERRDAELMLAGVARSMASDAMDALASRFHASPTGGGQMALVGQGLQIDPQNAQATGAWRQMSIHDDFTEPDDVWHRQESLSVSAQDLLTRSSFVLALDDGKSGEGTSALTLWGAGSTSGFSSSPDAGLDVEGAFTSGWSGLDYRVQSLLVGLAVAHSSGTVGQVRAGGAEADTDMTLTRVVPYAQLQVESGLEVWAMLGVGSGEMEVTVDRGNALATNLVSFMGAMGGRQALNDWNGIDLAARADAFISTLRSEGTAHLPGASGNAQRVRLLVEGSRLWMEDADQRVVPRFTLGGRWDGGTGDSGVGLEAGGGFFWTHAGMGLRIELQGRYLLMHTAGGYEDWGASLDLHLDPGGDERGLMLGLSPALGDAAGGAERLYGDAGLSDLAANDNRRTGRLDAELAYGVVGFGGMGAVTPYAGLTLEGTGTTRHRLGSHAALGSMFDLIVESNRTEQVDAPASHGLSAQLGLRW